MISFYFLFLYWLLMVDGLLRFARNDEGVKGNNFFFFSVFCGVFVVCGLLHSARNDEGGKGWYSQTRHCESCLQLVAISVWDTIIYSWNSFYFLFLYLLFVACGGLPPFIRGEVAKQQGGWERNWKLKIEN